ncbi:MAG: sugar ABC transporter substrate-binding protein [Thermodesulfobacteriota bacterium]
MKKSRLLLVIALALLMAAPSLGAAADKKFMIGFIPRAFVSVFFVTMADALKAEVAKNPQFDLQIAAPVDQKDIEGQIRIIEDLTQKKVDLLAVSVNDPKAVVPSLKEAQTTGIPVIILDTVDPLPGLEVLSLVGSNSEDGGEMVGKAVADVLKGKGKIAILEGVPGQYANEMRLKGFRKVMKNYPDIKVVASQPANWQRDLAMTTMENILQANPDLDLVWGVNDGMALGALKAITNAKLQDKIKVLGYNGDKEAVEAVSKGQMYSTILQQPAEIGRTVVKAAELIRTGKKKEIPKVWTIPIVDLRKNNAAQYLK